jgi:hypothetical protein
MIEQMSQHDTYVATNTLLMLICQPRLQIAIEIPIGLNYYYVLSFKKNAESQRPERFPGKDKTRDQSTKL